MGITANIKSQQLSKDAARARAEGRPVMVVKLNYPGFRPDFSGEVVDWSAMIAAVESQGWALCHFAGIADTKGRPEALAIFRLR